MDAYGRQNEKDDVLVIYDCQTKEYRYPMSEGRIVEEHFGKILRKNSLASEDTVLQIEQKIEELAIATRSQVYSAEFVLGNTEYGLGWYRVVFANPIPQKLISITFSDINEEVTAKRRLLQKTEFDELTGLMNRKKFCKTVQSILDDNEKGFLEGQYAFIYFDVIRFKAVNDFFGVEQGDRLLVYIANTLRKLIRQEDVACRLNADRFAVFVRASGDQLKKLANDILNHIARFDLSLEIACNMGIYVTGEECIAVDIMLDRAMLAQSMIKGSYVTKFNYYTREMRDEMLTEQEVVGVMSSALAERQFVVHYQP